MSVRITHEKVGVNWYTRADETVRKDGQFAIVEVL
jgi:hypothetical protein